MEESKEQSRILWHETKVLYTDPNDPFSHYSGIKKGQNVFDNLEDWHDAFRTYGVRKYRTINGTKTEKKYVVHSNLAIATVVLILIAMVVTIATGSVRHIPLILGIYAIASIALVSFFFVKKRPKEFFSYLYLDSEYMEEVEDVNPVSIYTTLKDSGIEEYNELWDMFSEYLDIFVKMMEAPVSQVKVHDTYMSILRDKKKTIMDIVDGITSAKNSIMESARVLEEKTHEDRDEEQAQYIAALYGHGNLTTHNTQQGVS